jgi:hypothetical protein
MRRVALDENVRLQPSEAAGRIEGIAKKEAGVEEEERMRSEPSNVDAFGLPKLKRRMASGEKFDRRQQENLKRMIVALNGPDPADANVKLAAFEHRHQGGPHCLVQLDLHIRATFRITMQELRKDAIDLGRGSDPEDAGIRAPEQLRSLAERVHRAQDVAAIGE